MEPSKPAPHSNRRGVVSTLVVVALVAPFAAISPWALSVVLILVCGVCVAFEFALVKLPLRELERAVSLKVPGAGMLLDMKRELNAMLAACQFGITLTSLGLTLALEPALEQSFHGHPYLAGASVPLAMTIGAFFHVTFGELVPKGLALVMPHRVLYFTAPFMALFRWLAIPFVRTFNAVANEVVKLLTGKNPDTDAHHDERIEIDEALRTAHREGQIAPRQLQVMKNVLAFSELTAREVMTPARSVIALDTTHSWDDNFKLAEEHGYSRFPVVAGNPHDVIGYVRRSELLKAELTGLRNLEGLLHPIERRPESASLALLNLFRGVPLVACYDEHDSFSGLLTAEDVIEQIVGEIYDETDDIESAVGPHRSPDGSMKMDGATILERAAEPLGLALDELPQDVDTIGGLVLKRLARQPARGDKAEIGRWIATVDLAQGFRIKALTFTPIGASPPGDLSPSESGRRAAVAEAAPGDS